MPFSSFSRSRSKGGASAAAPPVDALTADALTAEDVVLVYEGALGRTPAPEEIEHQLGHAASLRALVQAVLTSEELVLKHQALAALDAAGSVAAEAAPEPQRVVNIHTDELEPYGYAPGTWSADGVAVTGRRGWVFLGSGSNAILDQYRGIVELPPAFDEQWAEAMAARRAGAEALGAAFVAVIVPDKLPVLTDAFPDPLPGMAQAPAPVLSSRSELGLLYPVAELAAVPEGAYLRTDTHLTYAGNRALATLVAERLGVTLPGELAAPPSDRYLISGDLGSRYSPPIVEVITNASSWGGARLVESNRDQLIAVGAHIGTQQALRNDTAADPRTLVIFGDSYAFAAEAYQGLAWFMAQAFREVHFLWVPFGWDPDYAAAVGAEAIICQGAERFAIRPPELRVDIHKLAAESLARMGGEVPPPVPAAPASKAPLLAPDPEAPIAANADSERALPEEGAGSDWPRRFPPPSRPWTHDYAAAHQALVGEAIDDAALRAAAAVGGPLPDGYAVGFDERAVEYPWMFGQGLSGRVLDAGSTFNHTHILDRALALVDELAIVTLAPEGHQFIDRSVSYVFADLRDLPFRDRWFDTVVSLSTLEHVGKDNVVYGAEATMAGDPDAEVARAAKELRRVVRPGGRILLSVPYGRREDHGWFRQFDAEDLARLIDAFEAPSHAVSIFSHALTGWQGCTAEEAAELAYRDYNADPVPVADRAAAARGVACVVIDV